MRPEVRAKLIEGLELVLQALRQEEGDRPSSARPKRERRPRALTPPAGEATPIVSAAADRLLRERGWR